MANGSLMSLVLELLEVPAAATLSGEKRKRSGDVVASGLLEEQVVPDATGVTASSRTENAGNDLISGAARPKPRRRLRSDIAATTADKPSLEKATQVAKGSVPKEKNPTGGSVVLSSGQVASETRASDVITLGTLCDVEHLPPAFVPTLGGRRISTHRTRWATAWSGSLSDPHCGLCGTAYRGGWSEASTHLPLHHPTEWSHIQASGGLGSSQCMGCECGYTSLARNGAGGWNRVDARWHRLLHVPGGAKRPGGIHNRSIVCNIDGCTHPPFRTQTDLTAHQEGVSHYSIPYYCPLTSEHCHRAPCSNALGEGGVLIGRQALRSHLFYYHKGHFGAVAGLDLTWGGLKHFRVPGFAGISDDPASGDDSQ